MERNEEIRLKRVPETQFARYPPTEKLKCDIDTVSSVGSGGESEQLLRLEPFENPPVRSRFSMVKLVYHDDVEMISVPSRELTIP